MRIPPRKRRRLVYEDANGIFNEDDVHDDSFGLQVDSLREDDDGVSNESQDDEYMDPEVADKSYLEEELKGLQEDLHHNGLLIESAQGTRGLNQRSTRAQTRNAGLGLSLPYYGPYYNPLLDEYFNDEPCNASSPAVGGSRHSERREKQMRGPVSSTDEAEKFTQVAHVARRSSAASNKSVHFVEEEEKEEETTTPATVRIADESDDEDDGDYDPDEAHDSDKENTKPGKGLFEEADGLDTESSSSFAPSAHSQDESSPFGSSPSDSSTEQYSEREKTADPVTPSHQNSGSLKTSTILSQSKVAQTRENDDEMFENRDSPQDPNRDLQTKASKPMAPPGLGLSSTQKRNARRRASKLRKKMEKGSLLIHDEPTDKLEHSDLPKYPGPMTVTEEIKGSQIEARIASFESRKQALLDSIMSEGPNVHKHAIEDTKKATITRDGEEVRNVDDRDSIRLEQVDAETYPQEETYSQAHVAVKDPKTLSFEVPDSCPDDIRTVPKEVEADAKAKSVSPREVSSLNGTPKSSQPRRARLDLASSKRMLFGSLGLRTPKTKEDEIALREKLMKDARPTHILQSKAESAIETGSHNLEDDHSWRERIDLRAVECCYEGIKLSTPPFPFIQRWDPQQQRFQNPNNSRNTKTSKKRKRNRSAFPEYEQEHSYLDKTTGQAEIDSAIDNDQTQDQNSREKANDLGQDDIYPHQESKENLEASKETDRAQDLIQKNNEGFDLPPLPDNLSVYPELQVGACDSNAIIAFKRFMMSAETGWQPCISDYVTALVNTCESDDVLSVTLAKRDRAQHNARFDRQTGERLYDKFEMPGFDGDASADDGILEIPFNELINPRLVRPSDTKARNQNHDVSEPVQMKNNDGYVTSERGDHGDHDSTASPVMKGNGTSQEMRGNILQLIQESGWRSSLDSELDRNLQFSAGNSRRSKSKDSVSQANSANSPKERHPVLPEVNSDGFNALDHSEIQSPQPPKIAHPEEERELPSGAHPRVEYPTLGPSSDDAEGLQEQRQHRSVSLENNQPTLLQSSISPPSLRGHGRKQSFSHTPPDIQRDSHSPAPVDGVADSEEEFPELFSQAFEARMSQELPIKDESSQDQDIQRIPLSRSKSGLKRKSNTAKNSNFVNSKMHSSSIESQTDGHNDSSYQPLDSQLRQSSQVIDLTISSDPAEPMETVQDENDTSSYHPNSSPGWVNKSKANRSIGLASKNTSKKRKTRSR